MSTPSRRLFTVIHLSTRYKSTSPTVQRGFLTNAYIRPQRYSFLAQQCRHFSFKQRFRQDWNNAKRDYPIVLPILLTLTTASLGVLGLFIYDDLTRPQVKISGYPDAVEKYLRSALHAVYVRPDPESAELRFVEALKAAEQSGMDMYGVGVMGIRIRLAEMLENFGKVKASIEVLEAVVQICQQKVRDIDAGVAKEEPEAAAETKKSMLKQIVQSKVKIASLCESEYVRDSRKAKEVLSQAIEMLVKASNDPGSNGFSEQNDIGLNPGEIASMLSQMGDLYATTGEEANAVQTYMLALQPLRLSCGGSRSCKEVQVFSNIASTMSLAMKKPGATINGKPVDEGNLPAARHATLRWAEQAIATAEQVKPEERDDICELALISAELTRADLLLDDNKLIAARQAYRSMIPRLQQLKLDNLVASAQRGLQKAGESD